MWKNLGKLLQTLFTLAKDLEQTRTDLKELRKDLTDALLITQKLDNEIKLLRQEATSERQKMAMYLEIEILKFKNQLPPVPTNIIRQRIEEEDS